eukprot:gene825-1605_t
MDETDSLNATILKFLALKNVNDPEIFLQGLNSLGRDRLKGLVSGDITSSTDETTFETEFSNFLEVAPEWNCDYGEYSLVKNQLVTVFRRCENCLIINIGLYEADNLEGEELKKFLIGDNGGDSKYTLKIICNKRANDLKPIVIPNIHDSSHNSICDELIELLAQSPALVSMLCVYDDFHTSTAVRFEGQAEDGGQRKGHHAMVLVGARKTLDGRYYFLLMNWWRGRYFIEVPSEYLSSSEANVTFVTTPVTSRMKNLPVLTGITYAETTIDSPERLLEC